MSNVISLSNNPKALSETLFSEGQGLRLQPEAKVNFGSVNTEYKYLNNICTWSHAKEYLSKMKVTGEL